MTEGLGGWGCKARGVFASHRGEALLRIGRVLAGFKEGRSRNGPDSGGRLRVTIPGGARRRALRRFPSLAIA
jgi:hypothetical protein